ASCDNHERVWRQAKLFSTQLPVVRLKKTQIDARANYSHSAARFSYWTSSRELGQPLGIYHHACSGIAIGAQFARMRSVCQQSLRRPPQDRTRITRIDVAGVSVAATVKKAASGDVPHVVNADHNTYSSWQRLQPMRNIKPVSHRVKVHHLNLIQLFR